MNLSPQQRLALRDNLLIQLKKSGCRTCVSTLHIGAGYQGFRVEQTEIEDQLRYLEGKGLVAIHKGQLSAGYKTYTITSEGIDYLEENNLG